MVKVVYAPLAQVEEHIWVDLLRLKEDGSLAGLIANAPHARPDLKRGDPVIVVRDRVSDWGYVLDGQMHGFYTIFARCG
ncbi:MAG: DUF2314 domain-containing protein [Pseudomonadota bacterium]